MLKELSLKKLSIFVFVVLLSIAAMFSVSSYLLIKQVNGINMAWLSFKSQHAEKARLETSLRATWGYGGMIHDFKNYILRKDFSRLAQLQKSMGAAQTIVSQYLALSTTQAEKLVLEDIQEALNNYQKGIELARNEIKKGKNSKQIDQLVMIDDQFALRGLDILQEEIANEYSYYKDKNQKPVLAAAIRAELGYGGMIHAFKNYVLRGNEKYYKKTLETIVNTEGFIASYRKLTPTIGERTALDDIINTLQKYKGKLIIAQKLVKKGSTPEQIDQSVRVNDKHALRGLITLDHDIILQIEEKSNQLSLTLMKINEEEEIYAYISTSVILLLAIYLYFIFSTRIIKPISELSIVMTELSTGNTDVSFNYPKTEKTEMGEMARALNVFKEHEKKREQAEKEIRRLAMTDPLTGLANRNLFEKRYDELVSLANRKDDLLAVFALDLDKFKPVNDDYGHAAGDAVLSNVAKNLLLIFRETDLVARLGGDEFNIILYAPESIEKIKNVAQRVIKALSEPILVEDNMITVGASIGIAIRDVDSIESMESLMKRADMALYEAKDAGRNTYRIHDGPATLEAIPLENKKHLRKTDSSA